MKNKTLIIILLCISTTLLSAQNIDDILAMVIQNNTTLKASRQIVDAEKIGHRTGLTPNNPEVEFAYMWGSPTDIGNRINFTAKQEFDFPSAYAYRNDIAKLKNEQAELEYQKAKQTILLETRLLCCDILYYNSLRSELEQRLRYAKEIATLYQKRFDSGDCNILEYNKSRLHLLNITKDLETNDLERKSLLTKLEGLNGGITINFSSTEWPSELLPTNFEEWYVQAATKNPLLTWLATEINLAQKEIKLNYANAAPKFSAGYTMEQVVGQKYQGITVGMSIPLWQDAKKIKYAKAKNIAAENTLKDKQLQFYNHLKNLHTKAIALQTNYIDYEKEMKQITSYKPLQKALDKGEISLIDYLMEYAIYYESHVKMLQLRMDAEKIYSELQIYL